MFDAPDCDTLESFMLEIEASLAEYRELDGYQVELSSALSDAIDDAEQRGVDVGQVRRELRMIDREKVLGKISGHDSINPSMIESLIETYRVDTGDGDGLYVVVREAIDELGAQGFDVLAYENEMERIHREKFNKSFPTFQKAVRKLLQQVPDFLDLDDSTASAVLRAMCDDPKNTKH